MRLRSRALPLWRQGFFFYTCEVTRETDDTCADAAARARPRHGVAASAWRDHKLAAGARPPAPQGLTRKPRPRRGAVHRAQNTAQCHVRASSDHCGTVGKAAAAGKPGKTAGPEGRRLASPVPPPRKRPGPRGSELTIHAGPETACQAGTRAWPGRGRN
jgi:hypothetical protein